MPRPTKPFPPVLPLRKMIGPSFLILALGLGSGEIILWPYLTANYGLGIAWGALLGITFQFFLNMEIERYTLVKGESIFVGIRRLFKRAPYWFILSTFFGFGLPGIAAAAGKLFATAAGFEDHKWLAIILLVLIGLILSLGTTVYGMMERITKTIIILGVPAIFLITIVLTSTADWTALFAGFVGRGVDFQWLPEGLNLAVFLGAFAYAGAGGNLNLTQSIYIKEKGYGMGKYSQKVAGLFRQTANSKNITLTGTDFADTKENRDNFHHWWKKINLEHGIIFWLVGLITMSLLMLLSYVTAYGLENNADGIQFVINQHVVISRLLWEPLGSLFLIIAGIMLFQTQLGVLDSTSRIMSENSALIRMGNNFSGTINLPKLYSIFLWAQICFGVILFLFNITEPKALIVLGAVINAIAMFIHVGLTNWTNHKLLPKPYQARTWRYGIMILIFSFLGIFSVVTLWDKLT